MQATSSKIEYFLYKGQEEVPRDISHLKVASSVTEIPARKFENFKKLAEVILQEGVVVIGESAFSCCDHLKYINVSSTVRHIRRSAFNGCSRLQPPNLHEGLETIGQRTFACCNFRHFRIPSSVEEISEHSFHLCDQMLSIEISPETQAIRNNAFVWCQRLRNVAIPSAETEIGDYVFMGCHDLLKVFDNQDDLIAALKTRFDGLPIHKVCYFQSHFSTETTFKKLQDAIKSHDGGGRQDCLGMTPLHILALSTKQDLELYRMLVESFPEDLITNDNWGDLPIYYACMVNAPLEIIQFLFDSHKTRFQNYELDWMKMMTHTNVDGELELVRVETAKHFLEIQKADFPNQKVNFKEFLEEEKKDYLTLELLQLLVHHQVGAFSDLALDCEKILVDTILPVDSTELDSIQKSEMVKYLLDIQKTHFPDQKVGFDFLEDRLGTEGWTLQLVQLLVNHHMETFPDETLDWKNVIYNFLESDETILIFVVQASIAKRVEGLGLKEWRLEMQNLIEEMPGDNLYPWEREEGDRKSHINWIHSQLEKYELKDATSLLELGLWNGELGRFPSKAAAIENENQGCDNKEDIQLNLRQNCHINCGADIVIPNVLPFLNDDQASEYFSQSDGDSSNGDSSNGGDY